MSICRAFLNQHAPKKVDGESARHDAKAGRPTHIVPEETARDGDVGEASVNLPAAPELTDANPGTKRRRRARRTTSKPNVSTAPKSTPVKKRSARSKAVVSAPPTAPRRSPETVTPLRIPYGNKEVALRLGAHYGARGWYAPPGVDVSAFVERGWLVRAD
jgi:DNA topoisomerase-3